MTELDKKTAEMISKKAKRPPSLGAGPLVESKKDRRALVRFWERHPDCIVLVDEEGELVWANMTAAELAASPDFDSHKRFFRDPESSGRAFEMALSFEGRDERSVFDVRTVPFQWDGQRLHVATIRDVTRLARLNKRLARDGTRLREPENS